MSTVRDDRPQGEMARHWPVVLAGLTGNALGAGGVLYFSLASFVRPLEQTFGWSRLQTGAGATFFTLASVVALPVVGRLCDRFGPRRTILVSIAALTATLPVLALIPANLALFYASFALCTLAGAGTLGLTYAAAVSGCFDRRRGLALGMTLSGAGLAAFALPLLLQAVIAAVGWRAAWLVLAALAAVQFPIAWRLIPARASGLTTPEQSSGRVSGSSVSPAWRELRFWIMTLPYFAVALVMSGLIVNSLALLADRGITPARAAAIASLVGIGIVIARLAIGFVVDYVQARWLAASVFVVTALGALCLRSGEPALAALGLFCFGFTAGAEYDLLAFMASRYFGRGRQNAVLGLALALFNAGAVLSPLLVGYLYSRSSNYDGALLVCSAGCVVAAAVMTRLGPYPPLTDRTVTGPTPRGHESRRETRPP